MILQKNNKLEMKVKTLEEEMNKKNVVITNLNARVKMLEFQLAKSINGVVKKKTKSHKKRKRAIHHQRGYSDSVHNPSNYTMISHHKRSSSGSGSSGNQWKKLFLTEAMDDGSDTINLITDPNNTKNKGSYDGSGTIYTNESNYMQESTTKVLTKSKQQPSQAAIVTKTTTITTTPLQNYVSSKHGKRASSIKNKRCFDNVTQKRKWMVRERTISKDLNISEIKDPEESKYYHNMHNSSIEIEQRSGSLLKKAKNSSIYNTHDKIQNNNDSLLKDKAGENDLLGGGSTLKRKQWKIKYSLKCHLDSVRSLYFNTNMSILASASEDHTIRLWKADAFTTRDIDEDYLGKQPIVSYMTLRGHKDPLFSLSGPGSSNVNSNNKLLYSGGQGGEIRIWEIPSPVYFDSLESTHENQHCIGVIKYHTDCVWDLQHHQTENCILSLSSDNKIALWKTLGEDERIENFKEGDLNIISEPREVFKNKELFSKYYDTPTTC